MKRYPNDVSLEAKPSFWIFQGASASLFIVGIIVALVSFRAMLFCGVEGLHALVFSLIPLALITVYVWAFVKDKAPSYASDLLDSQCFGLRVTLYRWGLLERPPAFGGEPAAPVHPSELSSTTEDC